jgi:DNA-binding CsgD family transcriptional regulator
VAKATVSDLHQLVDVVECVLDAPADDPVPAPALAALRDLLGAHTVGYCEASSASYGRGFERVTRPPPAWLAEGLDTWGRDDPTHVAHRQTEGTPVAISDFLGRRAFEATGLYSEVCRPLDTADSIRLYLRAAPGLTRFVFVDRDRRGFDRRERSLLALLYAPFSARAARGADEPPAHASDRLTRRETQVLELLASGQTNKQIAAHLMISQYTVRTHLEHSFRKLAATTRTEAAITFLKSRAGDEAYQRPGS